MKKVRNILFAISFIWLFCTCNKQEQANEMPVKVAFMADVHLHDIYGELSDTNYKGVVNPGNGKHTLARTMQSQLSSTRIFNENYFAFLAALDDAVEKNITYVVLPGDFSDDGQPVNIRGLKKILSHYQQTHGLRFVLTTGNHDPVRPFSMDAGKKDFLGEGGKNQPIMSKQGMFTPKTSGGLNEVVSRDIRKMGYEEILEQLIDFGFSPKESDLYWETPFSEYKYNEYTWQKAKEAALFQNRHYTMKPLQGTVPDVSYLVEPENGLWFLAIDANVYVPKPAAKHSPDDPKNYNSASIGYSQLLSHKKHIIDWVTSVTQRAKQLNKKLVVFSHYPMIDFNDDASGHIKNLLGDGKMQLHRIPTEDVAKMFADAGVKVHFGGHLHINDTGYRKYENGNSLVNIQIPSLAAYIPAYKIATFQKDKVEIETVIIDSVPGFKELFPLYEMEHEYLKSIQSPRIWNKDVLTANTYHEFTNWHLKELVRFRFLKKDWPEEIKQLLLNSSGKQLAQFAGLQHTSSEFENWTGFDLIFDLYRLRSADKLAITDIGAKRLEQYQLLVNHIIKTSKKSEKNEKLVTDLKEFAHIFSHFLNGVPADHFVIELGSGAIKEINTNQEQK